MGLERPYSVSLLTDHLDLAKRAINLLLGESKAGSIMVKLVVGSLTFVAGLFLCFTGVGVLIGLPMVIGGLGMGMAGMGSLGVTAVKTGVAAGKLVNSMGEANASNALPQVAPPPPAAGRSVADEITKLAELLSAGHITQDEFNSQKAALLKA